MPNQTENNQSYPHTIEDIDELKKGFSFIDDEYLLTNIAYTMQHLLFSLQVFNDTRIPGPLKYSLGKIIIIDTASIIEALCHYWVQYKIRFQGYIESDFFNPRFTLKEIKPITLDREGYEVVAAYKIKDDVDINGIVRFIDLINALLHKNLITNPLGKKLKTVAKWRNMIHLMGLDDEDRKYFSDDDTKYAFEVASKLKALISKDIGKS